MPMRITQARRKRQQQRQEHGPGSVPSTSTLDPDPTMESVIRMLHGDDYWQHRLKRVLNEKGFQVLSVEREEVHPVWHLRMKRGNFLLDPDNGLASRQVRKVLVSSGFDVRADEFRVLRQYADRIWCVFLMNLGTPGMVT